MNIKVSRGDMGLLIQIEVLAGSTNYKLFLSDTEALQMCDALTRIVNQNDPTPSFEFEVL